MWHLVGPSGKENDKGPPFSSSYCFFFSLSGLVNTELFRHMSIWLKPLFWLFFRDTTSGAQTSIYCATEEGIEKYSGRYFANCRLHDPKPHARDDAVAKKLWEVSERMVGLAN